MSIKKIIRLLMPFTRVDFGTQIMNSLVIAFLLFAAGALIAFFGWDIGITPLRWIARIVTVAIALLLIQHIVGTLCSLFRKYKTALSAIDG